MTLAQSWERFTQYISEAVGRIFSPNDDRYPETGIQPFEGEPYRKSSKSYDW